MSDNLISSLRTVAWMAAEPVSESLVELLGGAIWRLPEGYRLQDLNIYVYMYMGVAQNSRAGFHIYIYIHVIIAHMQKFVHRCFFLCLRLKHGEQ